jgi:tetraacyldisaccharide 4'-kinase
MIRKILYNLATDKYRGIKFLGVKFLLLCLSFVYGLIIRFLIFLSLSDQKRLNLKVISVGNITLGGTGKTPLVELISLYLQKRKIPLAILTRGYKSRRVDAFSDEPKMLAKNLKRAFVILDKDRYRAAKRASREYGVDTVILDDGFQQWRIKKDLEIVVIDARNPFGNRNMLPRGIMREPLSSLRRADIFVLTKVDLACVESLARLKKDLIRYQPKALVVEAFYRPVGFYNIKYPDKLLGLDKLDRQNKALLLSGIADPDSFLHLVRGLGVDITLDLRFPDHHHYTLAELGLITSKAKEEGIKLIITTDKDASRLTQDDVLLFSGLDVIALRVELGIVKHEKEFFNRLLSLYSF